MVIDWDFVGVKGRLHALFYTTVANALQHLQIWYLQGVLEPIPSRIREIAMVKFWGSQKLHTDFQLHGRSSSLTVMLFKGQLQSFTYPLFKKETMETKKYFELNY